MATKMSGLSNLGDLGAGGLTITIIKNSDIDKFLSKLDNLLKIEIDKISCGLWEQSRPMFLILDDFNEVEKFSLNKYFRRHSNIRLLARNEGSHTKLSEAKFDVWRRKWRYSFIDFDSKNNVIIPNQKFDFMKHKVKAKKQNLSIF